jgi:hypothetical protein
MAIYKMGDQWGPKPDSLCMLCEQSFTKEEPVVMWAGPTDLCLHGGCAGTFVLRLARDAWEVEREANDGKYKLTLRGPGWQLAPPRCSAHHQCDRPQRPPPPSIRPVTTFR